MNTTEKVLIGVVLLTGLCLAARLLYLRRVRRLEAAGLDEWDADLEAGMIPDEDYLTMISTEGGSRHLAPVFTGRDGLPRHQTIDASASRLAPLPPPLTRSERMAMALERSDYLTGRAMRVIRREAEMRAGWHWDELAGTWNAGRDLVESLPWDDWLRELLDDRVAA